MKIIMRAGLLCVLMTVLSSCLALGPTETLSADDQTRLKQLFELAVPYQSLSHAHYAVMGISALGGTVPKPQDACAFLKSNVETSDVQSIYLAVSAAQTLGNCKITLGSAGQETLSAAISESAEMVDLFYAVTAQSALGITVNSADVLKALDARLKADDSILSTSYALHVASLLSKETKVDKYFEMIEDIVAQADIVEDKYLQFDNLQQASVFVTGSYTLAAKVNKKPLISNEQAVQLANYILTRKATQTIRNAYHVVAAIKTFSQNAFQVPVAFSRSGSMAVSNADPTVKVSISDLMGRSIGQLTVKASAVTAQVDDTEVATDAALAATKDSTLYQFDLMKLKPAAGFYSVRLTSAPTKPSNKLIGLSDGEVTVKVTTEVSVSKMDISVVDREQSITAKTVSLKYPQKSKTTLDVDFHQNIVFKFSLTDKAGKSMEAHQTFVRVSNIKSGQEVIFTAEKDPSGNYKFVLDVSESGKEYFNQQSGKYTVHLIVGDAVIQNPISWNVIDVNLKFPESSSPRRSGDKPSQYMKKPDLDHMFRVPEKRPPVAVSTAFTGLVFLPLLILLALWIKLGVNINNFTFSIGALGFHIGLGAIFALFYCYWAYLDMFSTLKYLTIIGIITFVCGNKMLRSIADKKN